MNEDYKKDFDEFFRISHFDDCDMENLTKDEFYEKFKEFQEKKKLENSLGSNKLNDNNSNSENIIDLNNILSNNSKENLNNYLSEDNINVDTNIFNNKINDKN